MATTLNPQLHLRSNTNAIFIILLNLTRTNNDVIELIITHT
ncbi:hypothetical protein VCHENC02_3172 [Vibrio harveyi]|uniref:Uncharacterized protein n=1 Tax=Vibrio harveyi TaxID=669 RepID=A0A454CXP4_VIBHA|nr:hypothetical protein VCHENC02_3172 [Vibrio harveyi]